MEDGVVIKLPKDTCRPASGPVFRYACQKLTVDYDTEEHYGKVEWTRLEFSGVDAVKYIEEGHTDVGDMGEYNHLKCWKSSAWLNELVARWKKCYPQADPNASAQPLHYILDIDHAGSLHVIASDVKIIENPELDALNSLPTFR